MDWIVETLNWMAQIEPPYSGLMVALATVLRRCLKIVCIKSICFCLSPVIDFSIG